MRQYWDFHYDSFTTARDLKEKYCGGKSPTRLYTPVYRSYRITLSYLHSKFHQRFCVKNFQNKAFINIYSSVPRLFTTCHPMGLPIAKVQTSQSGVCRRWRGTPFFLRPGYLPLLIRNNRTGKSGRETVWSTGGKRGGSGWLAPGFIGKTDGISKNYWILTGNLFTWIQGVYF